MRATSAAIGQIWAGYERELTHGKPELGLTSSGVRARSWPLAKPAGER